MCKRRRCRFDMNLLEEACSTTYKISVSACGMCHRDDYCDVRTAKLLQWRYFCVLRNVRQIVFSCRTPETQSLAVAHKNSHNNTYLHNKLIQIDDSRSSFMRNSIPNFYNIFPRSYVKFCTLLSEVVLTHHMNMNTQDLWGLCIR